MEIVDSLDDLDSPSGSVKLNCCFFPGSGVEISKVCGKPKATTTTHPSMFPLVHWEGYSTSKSPEGFPWFGVTIGQHTAVAFMEPQVTAI